MFDIETIWMWNGRSASDSDREHWETFKAVMQDIPDNAQFLEYRTDEQLAKIRDKLESQGWEIGLGGSGASQRIFPWHKRK